MTSEEKKGAIFVVSFYGSIACWIIKPAFLDVFTDPIAFIPLMCYGVTSLFLIPTQYLQKYIDSERQGPELDRKQTFSLTLSGFCFTSLSLLLSYFKGNMLDGTEIIFFFGFALIAFISAFTILRFRITTRVEYLAEALIDNGLWCILVGMWRFFRANQNTPRIASLFFVILFFYGFCVLRNLYYYLVFSKRISQRQ